ncbi:MAG: hypothetical protein JOZ91_06230 [Candidatus Eremiobacteraeota bacterium]|nr:hypothetical protein [Candidatus Eremiobacteraeota bacterium]MBV8204160.1 hypothetical protein [Candidatus Eremiobacteraeota bacterium]MBV8339211.1 hypothetical protein [Candidatus Eremiobacteraeota bacterium]
MRLLAKFRACPTLAVLALAGFDVLRPAGAAPIAKRAFFVPVSGVDR